MDKVVRICINCNKKTKHTYWKKEIDAQVAWSFCLNCGNAIYVTAEVVEYVQISDNSNSIGSDDLLIV